MKKQVLLATTSILVFANTPALPQSGDLTAVTKQFVINVNTVSEIYEKKTWTNGDVVVIAEIACSDIRLITDNGKIRDISNFIDKYPSKNDLKTLTTEQFAKQEREYFSKQGASENTQRVIARKVSVSDQLRNVSTKNAEMSLNALGQTACYFAKNVGGDPKAEAGPDLYKVADALANAVFGVAAAVIDVSVAAESGGTSIALVGFVSTSWAWDRISEAWKEVKEIVASLTNNKGIEGK